MSEADGKEPLNYARGLRKMEIRKWQRRQALAASVAAMMTIAAGALASARGQMPRAETVVRPLTYVSLEPVPRGRSFEVAVVAEIQQGFHINANKVLEDYLIPTTVEPDLPKGMKFVEAAYPKALLKKFEFSDQKMAVYEESVTIRLKLSASSDAPLGEMKLPVTLRYQACNDTACLPPVRKALTVNLRLAPAGTVARAINTEIFQKK